MRLVKFKCVDCDFTFVADSKRWHLDFCPKCNKNAVDLELWYCRMIGHIQPVSEFLPPHFDDYEEYQSALLGWLNDSDEEYALVEEDETSLMIIKVEVKPDG